MIKRIPFGLTALIFLSSCAATYKPIAPGHMSYQSTKEEGDFSYSYQYDVLALSQNKKYAKKEINKGVKVVAIKIENNTGRTINFRDDIKIYAENKRVTPLEPMIVQQQLKQQAPLYLLWGLFWVTITTCQNDDCSVIPLPVGLVIGLFNMGKANASNQEFLAELTRHNILDEDILDGSTAFGLIGIPAYVGGPLKIQLNY